MELNNFLHKWYNDFYIAYDKKPSYDKFINKVSKSDYFLYELLKNGRIKLIKNEKNEEKFIWFKSKNGKIIKNCDYTFFKYLFSRDNVFINFNFKEYFSYRTNEIYKFENGVFVLTTNFDTNHIRFKYIEELKCKNRYIYSWDSYKQTADILVQSEKISFLNSDFSKKSEFLIKEILKNMYIKNKDTLFIYFRYHNIEDAICLE